MLKLVVLLNIFVAFFQESSESSKEQDLFVFLITIDLLKKYPPPQTFEW